MKYFGQQLHQKYKTFFLIIISQNICSTEISPHERQFLTTLKHYLTGATSEFEIDYKLFDSCCRFYFKKSTRILLEVSCPSNYYTANR